MMSLEYLLFLINVAARLYRIYGMAGLNTWAWLTDFLKF